MAPSLCTAAAAAAAESAPSLPDVLIEDIFARMPGKSAQRCCCLSRSWAATLSSRRFVDRHLRLANRRGSPKLFFLPASGSDDDPTLHAWSLRHPLALEVVVRRDERLRRVAAVTRHCRGLVVLEADRPDMNPFMEAGTAYKANHYVCNPSTGQITALPEGKEAFGGWPNNHASFGIGYDSSIQKHKVVRLYCRGELPPACEVYVLDSPTGHWRPPAGAGVTKPPCWATNFPTHQSVFAQGHIFWSARPRSRSTGERVLMYFSIRDEVFGSSKPPDVGTVHWRITELRGRLCLFKDVADFRSYDIWVLRNHQLGAWDLHCRIDLDSPAAAAQLLCSSSNVVPLDIVDDGSRVLLRPDPRSVPRGNSEAHRLVVYSPATGDVEDLLAGGGGGGGMMTDHSMAQRVAAPYMESLESIGRPHEDIIFSSTSSQALALVFRRLPGSTLGQLKRVCRSWRAMIKTNRFVRLRNQDLPCRRLSSPLCLAPVDRQLA